MYLDGIQDPGNLGTIFRIATAFGFDGVVLSPDCCEVFSPKVIRASLGSVFWIPSLIGDLEWLKSQDALKIGLDAGAETPLNRIKIATGETVILVVGSEGNGIRREVLSLLDIKTCIPISKDMESLNASVAAGIAAYELSGRLFLLT
jgi:TrmH family RNA methyltransferase